MSEPFLNVHCIFTTQVDKLAEGAHQDFRLFLSAEPPPELEAGLPISLLQNSIKLTNEPPGVNEHLFIDLCILACMC